MDPPDFVDVFREKKSMGKSLEDLPRLLQKCPKLNPGES